MSDKIDEKRLIGDGILGIESDKEELRNETGKSDFIDIIGCIGQMIRIVV